jgi:hypothetical protein
MTRSRLKLPGFCRGGNSRSPKGGFHSDEEIARTEVLQRTTFPGTERGTDEGSGEHEGQWQTVRGEEASNGKALSDLLALKPYWGKPAVRNFREGNGNVGIIRSPLRAFALPDQSSECTIAPRRTRRGLVAYASFFRGKFAGVSGIGLLRLRVYQMYQVIPAMSVSANGTRAKIAEG